MKLQGEAGARAASRLLFHAREQGFFSYAILGKEEWEAVLLERGFAEEESSFGARPDESGPRGEPGGPGAGDGDDRGRSAASQAIRARYRLDSAGAMLAVALRYAPDVEAEPAADRAERGLLPLPLAEVGKPAARIGRFARGNWYGEIGARLAACAAASSRDIAEAGLPSFPPKHWHRFANSRLPEKALAVAAGLGAVGRNGLLIAEASEAGQERGSDAASGLPNSGATRVYFHSGARSSAVLLGLMLLPFDIEVTALPRRRAPFAELSLCGGCHSCVDACPSRALHIAQEPVSGRAFERARCIQHYSSLAETLPEFIEASWKDQLYGCDFCLEACPHFRPDPGARTDRGKIGGSFDAASIAGMEDAQLRALFRGSALDQKWIEPEALRRNARLAQRG